MTPEQEQRIKRSTVDLLGLVVDQRYARLHREVATALASAMQRALEQRRKNSNETVSGEPA